MSNVQGTSGALDDGERRQLLDIVNRLGSSPATVDGGQLATARNLAARAGFTRTKLALDQEIQRRGDGAQDPDALKAALRAAGVSTAPPPPVSQPAAKPPSALGAAEPEARPIWPFIIISIALVSGLSYISVRRPVAASIAREKRLQQYPF